MTRIHIDAIDDVTPCQLMIVIAALKDFLAWAVPKKQELVGLLSFSSEIMRNLSKIPLVVLRGEIFRGLLIIVCCYLMWLWCFFLCASLFLLISWHLAYSKCKINSSSYRKWKGHVMGHHGTLMNVNFRELSRLSSSDVDDVEDRTSTNRKSV